jgi:hypothetical protein
VTRTPRLTAEYAIGLPHGTYAAAPQSHHEPSGDLRAMVRDATIYRTPPPGGGVLYTLRLLQKENGINLCPPPAKTCWGVTGTPQELDYKCCDQDERCTYNGNDPACELGGAAIQAVKGLPIPRDVLNQIGSYVHG